jgi:hypothetical protein
MPRIPGLLERIQQPIYDQVTIKPGIHEYQFFQEPYDTGKSLPDVKTLNEVLITRPDCPLCREPIVSPSNKTVSASMFAAIYKCVECSTWYHRNCGTEMSGCGTLGCEKKGYAFPSPAIKSRKTLHETNMECPGYIPDRKFYEVHSFSLLYEKTADRMDIDSFMENTLFAFDINYQNKFTAPLTVIENQSIRFGAVVLAEPFDLVSGVPFIATLRTNKMVKINTPFTVRCFIDGFYKREVR